MLLKLQKASKFAPVPLAPDGVHYFESDISASVYDWDWSDSTSVPSWPVLLNTTMNYASDSCGDTVDKVYASEFCALGRKKADSCHVYEGSPIVVKASGQEILAGIASYNPGCGKVDVPTLFARTSKGQIWAHKIIVAGL